MANPGDKIMLDPEYYQWRIDEGYTTLEPIFPLGTYTGEDIHRQVVYGKFGDMYITIPLRFVRFLRNADTSERSAADAGEGGA